LDDQHPGTTSRTVSRPLPTPTEHPIALPDAAPPRGGASGSDPLGQATPAALFSTGGAAIKATALTAWQVASFRSGVAALAVLIFVPAARRGLSWRVGVVSLAYAITMVLFVASNKTTTAANAIFLQSTAPLYVLVLSPWLLRERIHRGDVIAMGVLAVGLAFVVLGTAPAGGTAPRPVLGNILALCSGLAWALTLVGLRWLGTRADGERATLSTVVVGNAIACIVCLPAALPVVAATTMDWGVIVYLGSIQIGLAYYLMTSGIRGVPAFEASMILLIEPALNPVWAWLVHGERPGALTVLGGSLILGATVLRSAQRRRG
jgi:drug/metabolite transporter (DMT)-like permease